MGTRWCRATPRCTSAVWIRTARRWRLSWGPSGVTRARARWWTCWRPKPTSCAGVRWVIHGLLVIIQCCYSIEHWDGEFRKRKTQKKKKHSERGTLKNELANRVQKNQIGGILRRKILRTNLVETESIQMVAETGNYTDWPLCYKSGKPLLIKLFFKS